MLMAVLALFAAGPDLTGVPSVSNRFGLGHMCPLTPTRALTAMHVIDPKPLDPDVKLLPQRWSDMKGNLGIAEPIGTLPDSDLAIMSGEFPIVFKLAPARPEKGATVYISSFGWGMKHEVTKAKVSRYVGGMIVYDKGAKPGSSGGCVLNEAGEVVGINVWGFGEEAGMAVDTFGFEFPPEKEEVPPPILLNLEQFLNEAKEP